MSDNRKYAIVSYDPRWKEIFSEEANILRSVFDREAVSVEHIGSTSVPGLSGKPIVDILVLVDDISIVDRLQEHMKKVGYQDLGAYVTEGARLFVRESGGIRSVNIHVFPKNHPHVKEMLQLRDYFRTHPDVAQEYSRLKIDLIARYPDNYSQYRALKDKWMNALKQKVAKHFECREKLDRLVSLENEEKWWKTELFEKETRMQLPAEIEIVALPPEEESNYNCFVYALGLQNDPHFLGNANWEFTRDLGIVFEDMIASGILTRIDVPKEGDMIVYRTTEGVISHVGLMHDTKTVISKWSWGPLLRHALFDVPNHYGNEIAFYEVSKEARNYVMSKRYSQA